MKKLLSVILCFVLVFSVTACGQNDVGTQNTVNYFDYYTDEFYAEMSKNTIVDGGTAKYCLLLPSDASEIIKFTADDFNALLREASGATLPVVYDGSAMPDGIDNYISLGETSEYSGLNLNHDYSTLNVDGFFVDLKDHNYFITGANDKGVLYGCYDLLKRYVGVRFVSRDCTIFKKGNTVQFAEYQYSMTPEFQQRSFLDFSMQDKNYFIRTTQGGEFGMDTVIGSTWATELGNIHTTVSYYVKREDYYASHPEFFASYTNPAADPTIGNRFDDVCYSNGITDDGKLDETVDISVAKAVIKTIKEYLAIHPERQFFMIGISDQYNAYCMCEKCVQREKTFGTKSGIMTMFVNVIADEINKWAKSAEGQALGIDHEINIIQFAYYWNMDPPVHKEGDKWVANDKLVIPNKNVYVRYAPLNANYAYSLGAEQQLQNFKDVVEGWSAISNNLMIYDYCHRLHWQAMWYPHLSNLSEQAKYLKDNNFMYWMTESQYAVDGIWCIDLVRYIVMNLWWDVNADVERLKDEFIELYNGSVAAPYVKELVRLFEENNALLKTKDGYSANVYGTSDITTENYPRALLEQAIALMDKAQTAIMNDNGLSESDKELYIKRLTEVRIIPEGIMLFNYDQYYMGGMDAKREYAKIFGEHAELIGLTYVTDSMTVKDYIESI